MLRASHEGSQKVVVRTVITVRFVPGAAIAKSILYCAGQLVFKESGHHLTGTDTIYFVTVRLCGVFPNQDGTFTAMTYTKSKTFKTENGARRWLERNPGE